MIPDAIKSVTPWYRVYRGMGAGSAGLTLVHTNKTNDDGFVVAEYEGLLYKRTLTVTPGGVDTWGPVTRVEEVKTYVEVEEPKLPSAAELSSDVWTRLLDQNTSSGWSHFEFVASSELQTDDNYSTEDIWVVVRFGDELYRKTGTWSSYDGIEWNRGVERVEHYLRQVDDWRPIGRA